MLLLRVHYRHIHVLVIPFSRKYPTTIAVNRRCDDFLHCADDLNDRLGSEIRSVQLGYEFFSRLVIDGCERQVSQVRNEPLIQVAPVSGCGCGRNTIALSCLNVIHPPFSLPTERRALIYRLNSREVLRAIGSTEEDDLFRFPHDLGPAERSRTRYRTDSLSNSHTSLLSGNVDPEADRPPAAVHFWPWRLSRTSSHRLASFLGP
jgi:hypothetical protein